ncbi:MAG: hypothetical protein LBJ17_02175 [Dysgonamonadaceae bacterium]|jgi:hypothetical protein|nr:hypothetical protein [Dysgonamonadaceae bacterium]
MGLTIQRKKDERVIRAFTHKLADIPDGVTVSVADFTQKKLFEGTPVGKDENGLYHIVKTAKVRTAADANATTYQVEKGHNFKVGDFLGNAAKAYAITAIDTSNASYDVLTVGTTLGAAAVGHVLFEGDKAAASGVTYKYAPVALVGESYDVDSQSNLVVNAWTIAQIREANVVVPIGTNIKDALKGIVFI